MTWDFAEANPLGPSAGGWDKTFGFVPRVVAELFPGSSGRVRQLDATAAVNGVTAPLVSTDPPYYDNIGYADLSDFFYVWLRRSLGGVYPDLFKTVLTPKAEELVATPYRFGGDARRAEEHFETGLREAFRRIREAANPDYPVTIFYAFKQAEDEVDGDGTVARISTGWEKMLEGLLDAGFSIQGTWPMRSELGNRMLSMGTNALASSIVLACRPRPADAGVTTRAAFVAALKRELPEALRTLQHGSIAPVDLAQAAIGPGMAVFSRYAKVLEPDGSAMRVRTALGLINAVLDEVLAEQEGEFDADTRFAVTWYGQHGFGEGRFGEADVLARARDTAVDGLVRAGIVRSGGGKVALLSREELDPTWDPAQDRRPTVWEATQHLVRRLHDEGENAAADLLARLGGLGDVARDLAYRLYLVAERKGWTEEARAYNALVRAWPDLSRLAEARRTAGPTQQALGLGG
jgi:putative DNA methylase